MATDNPEETPKTVEEQERVDAEIMEQRGREVRAKLDRMERYGRTPEDDAETLELLRGARELLKEHLAREDKEEDEEQTA